MMKNNKCATHAYNILQWIDIHECNQGFLVVNMNYSICILFLPSEVTKGIGKNHSRYETAVTIHYYYHVTASNTYHPPHMLSHTCLIITSSKEQGNNMHLLIHQAHNKDSHLINHPIKLRIHHTRITLYGHNHVRQLIWHLINIAQERDRSSYCQKPIVKGWTTPSSSWWRCW
jgi:hypothetical protein